MLHMLHISKIKMKMFVTETTSLVLYTVSNAHTTHNKYT